MFGNLGLTEILIIVASLALLFGAKKIPQLGRNLGEGIRNLSQGIRGHLDDDRPALPPPSAQDQNT